MNKKDIKYKKGFKSLFLFFKILWFFSVIFIILVYFISQRLRIIDYINNNYQEQEIVFKYTGRNYKGSEFYESVGVVKKNKLHLPYYCVSSFKKKHKNINGYSSVDFDQIRFDEKNEVLQVPMYFLKVIKFKNSSLVMLVEKLNSWVSELAFFTLYTCVSLIIMIFMCIRNIKKKGKVILTVLLLTIVPKFSVAQISFEAKDVTIKRKNCGTLTIEDYKKSLYLKKNSDCLFSKDSSEFVFCNFFGIRSREELVEFFSPNQIPLSYSKNDYIDLMKIYNESDRNYYLLNSKYTIDYGEFKDVFIKFINVNEKIPKKIYSCIYLQESNLGYQIKDMGQNFEFGLFLLTTNTNAVIEFLKESKTIDLVEFSQKTLRNIKGTKNENEVLLDYKFSPFLKDNIDSKRDKLLNEQSKIKINLCKTFYDKIEGKVFDSIALIKNEVNKIYDLPLESLRKDTLNIKEIISLNTLNNDYRIVKFRKHKTLVFLNNTLLDDQKDFKTDFVELLLKIDFESFIDVMKNKISKDDTSKIKKIKRKVEKMNKEDGIDFREIIDNF